MKQFLLIETRDPLEHHDVARMVELAAGLSNAGSPTELFLTDNAVIAARAGVAPFLEALADHGVTIRVDEDSLAERGIAVSRLPSGMTARGIDIILDALLAGASTIWR